ncbi:MAG: hypothetical protein ACOYK6_08235 [Chthoniobacterales bacterium]
MSFRNYHSFSTAVRRRAMPHGFDSMFAWTLFIFLLIGFTLFCWMGSFYVFGHPEKAANYNLLKRLHKLEDPQRFQITAAPRGEFLKPSQLLERFGTLTPIDIKRLNEALLRNFLRNYHQTRELVPYATGTYKVLTVLPLTKKNIFHPGVVALLQSLQQPEIFLEQVFTSNRENLPALQASLTPGQEIKLEKPLDLSAIIFMEQLRGGGLQFTTMPLLYGTYGNQENGQATFSLEPPETINIEGGLPILSDKEVESARRLASSSQTINAAEPKTIPLNNGEPSSAPLVRIMTEKPTQPPTKTSLAAQKTPQVAPQGASPSSFTSGQQKQNLQETKIAKAIPVATPAAAIPAGIPVAAPAAIPVGTPAVLPAIALNRPSQESVSPKSELTSSSPATLQPTVSSTPSTTAPLATPPPTDSPTPTAFNFSSSIVTAAQPPSSENTNPSLPSTTTATNPSSNSSSVWPLYEPGKMPRGRMMNPTELSSLADQGFTGERLYVQGDFAVTASGEHRAVLRYQSATTDLPIGRTGKIRIIVDYPQGTIPPAEGTSLSQDHFHPLMITDVKKEKDGTVNLYVREIVR